MAPHRRYEDEEETKEKENHEDEQWQVVASPVPDRPPSTPTYNYSVMLADDGSGNGSAGYAKTLRKSSGAARFSSAATVRDSVFVRGTLGGRDIEALQFQGTGSYRGRYRMWPGVVLAVLLLSTAGVLMAHYATKAHTKSQQRASAFEKQHFAASAISSTTSDGNSENTSTGLITDKELISDDGAIGNPKVYPASTCQLPNYLSKNGHIVAVAANGTEVPLTIKGVNWFGMETGQAMPFGLWDNTQNGTTAYQVASFLSRHKFNAVRLPLMVQWILENKVPNRDLLNKQENRGVNAQDYLSLLKSIVKVLQFRGIGVLISMHTLTPMDNGKLWYNREISEQAFLESVDLLTETLCSKEYWNVMGIDLKNEPAQATWGDGSKATDFRLGAAKIAERMLIGCPQWLGFVEGVNAKRTMTLDGDVISYYDWYGGGLQDVKTKGLAFSVANKVVWAPHYYTPAVYPQAYFFGGGSLRAGLQGYVELSDKELRRRVKATMDDMFGYLASETGPALLLGEFGGLYAKDLHPMKTTKRCTDFTIEVIKQKGWAGGFVWSLNPESEYQYNPADSPGRFFEGLVERDWLMANDEFINGMAAMDDMENLQPFPCFPAPAAKP